MVYNDSITDSESRRKIQNQFLTIERYRDFIGWLFDDELDYVTESEMWDKFDKYNEDENNKDTSGEDTP